MTRLATLAAAMMLAGMPAWGQTHQGGDPAVTPPPAEQEPGGQTAAAPGQSRQSLDQLAQDVMAAQQMGYLAADKNMPASYALLGDQVALLNSQINRQLDQVVAQNNLDLPREMNAQSRARFEAMKDTNRERFAQDFVAFIQETYPRIISGIEGLGSQAPNSPAVATLTREAVPSLRDQMRTAQQLAQGGGVLDQQSAEQPGNRGPIQRKDDPAVIPDTTAPPAPPTR